MSPLCQPVLVTMPPVVTVYPETGNLGFILPGLVPYDMTAEAAREWGRVLLALTGGGPGGWVTATCQRCGTGPRPCRQPGGRLGGLCASCARASGKGAAP